MMRFRYIINTKSIMGIFSMDLSKAGYCRVYHAKKQGTRNVVIDGNCVVGVENCKGVDAKE